MSPTVSVVIPSFNRAAPLARAVESVLAQRSISFSPSPVLWERVPGGEGDCRPQRADGRGERRGDGGTDACVEAAQGSFELIVVDDGSEDGTPALLEPFAARGVRCLRQENRGVSSARNRGAAAARGEWLAFLDSDDEWRPQKLARQLAYHRSHPGLRISQTGEIWIRNGVRVNPHRHHAKPEGDVFVPSLARCLVTPSAVMLRRELFEEVGGFDESLPVCEDYDLWLRIALRQPFGLLPEPLVIKHGGHPDQLSRRHWGMDRFRVLALRKLLADPALDPERRRHVREVLRAKCMVLANGARRRNREEEARHYLSLAEDAPT